MDSCLTSFSRFKCLCPPGKTLLFSTATEDGI